MEKTEVLAEVIANPLFRHRVRAISIIKANGILAEVTPDAGELAWAKLVVDDGYEAWMEAVLILAEASPATTAAAYDANDATYATVLDTVLPNVILAKGL